MTDMEKIEDYILEESHTKRDGKSSEKEDLEDILEPKIGIFHMIYNFISGLFHSKHKVGELNGKWAALFKLVIIIVVLSVPTLIAWGTWVTSEVFASKYHTIQQTDFEKRLHEVEVNIKVIDKLEIELTKISNKIDNLPPPDWRRRIELLERQQEDTEKAMSNIETTNKNEHGQILILLEGIKTKVDLMSNK